MVSPIYDTLGVKQGGQLASVTMQSPTEPRLESSRTRRIAVRMLVATGVTLAVLGGGIAVLCRHEDRHQEHLHRQQGLYRTDAAGQFLISELEAVKSDLSYLAEQDLLADFLADPAANRARIEEEYIRFAEHKGSYDQVRYLDTSGQEVIRVNLVGGKALAVAPVNLQSKSSRYYYRDALNLAAREVFVSDLDLNIEHGEVERPLKPVIRLLTPVFDRDHVKRGLLVLNYLGSKWMRQMESSRMSGQLMLINPQGFYLLGRKSEDAWGWLLGHDTSFARDFPLVWKRMQAAVPAQIETTEGLFTVGVIDPRPGGSGWRNPATSMEVSATSTTRSLPPESLLIVAHSSRKELLAGSRKLRMRLLAISGLALMTELGVAYAWALASVNHEDQIERRAQSEARLRRLSAELLSAQEVERRVISREIHDELGQQATAVQLDLKRALRQSDAARSRQITETAVEGMSQLVQSMHDMASRVRLSVLDDLGLGDAVRSTLDDFTRRTGIELTSSLTPRLNEVPTRIGEHVFRILQEALRNVELHANSKNLDVAIDIDNLALHMRVRDTGIGFRPQEATIKGRLGILGMRERVELLGGKFQLHSTLGEGTLIELAIPLTSHSIEPHSP